MEKKKQRSIRSKYYRIMWWLATVLCFINSAYGKSQWTRWSRLGDCSVTCGAGAIWQDRTCVGDNPDPICTGAQQRTVRCQKLACPEDECNCGCSLRSDSGNIRSVSPSKKSLHCMWNIMTKSGSRIKLTVSNFIFKYGNLRILGPKRVYHTLNKRSGREQFPFTITSEDNKLNLSLHYYKVTEAMDGVKLVASYETIDVISNTPAKRKEESILSIPTVVGISACVIIIIVATCLIIYRKLTGSGNKNIKQTEDEIDDNYPSSSTNSLRHGVDIVRDQKDAKQKLISTGQTLPLENNASLQLDQQRFLMNQNNIMTMRVNPAAPMYINQAIMNENLAYNAQRHLQYNQQSHVLLPNQLSLKHSNMGYVIQQPQINCTPCDRTMLQVSNSHKSVDS